MRLKRFNRVSCLYKSGLAVSLIAGLLAGCSSDFSRFTDGLTKSSGSAAGTPQNNAAGIYPPAPQKNAYAKVESGALPPPEPVAAAENPGESGEEFITHEAALPPAARSSAAAKSSPAGISAARPAGKTVYTVVAGDNLSSIARRYDVTVAAIKRDNDLSSDKILIGQKLTLAGSAAAKADKPAEKSKIRPLVSAPVPEPEEEPQEIEQAGGSSDNQSAKEAEQPAEKADTVIKPEEEAKAGKDNNTVSTGSAAVALAVSGTAAAVNSSRTEADSAAAGESSKAADSDKKKKADTAAMLWPVTGNIISAYGQRTGTSTNDGIDIAVPEGTKVKAADNGIIIYAGDGLKEFGNTILIRHDDNIVTVYGHNSKLLVQRGQQVERGEDIALSGSSGNAAVAKLHFEVRKNSSPVNPMKYLPPSDQL